MTGVDLDDTMLSAARKEVGKVENVEFQHLNMMEITQRFGPAAFNTILCFGNTLVHLENLEEISGFIKQTKSVLKRDGKLLIQIINYDRILDLHIPSLPTLETDEIRFVRNYHYLKDLHLIEFETILTLKSTGKQIHNKIHLIPIRKAELESILLDAGFTATHFFGNFKRDPLLAESIPMVITASA